jgi:hypothetical protein
MQPPRRAWQGVKHGRSSHAVVDVVTPSMREKIILFQENAATHFACPTEMLHQDTVKVLSSGLFHDGLTNIQTRLAVQEDQSMPNNLFAS